MVLTALFLLCLCSILSMTVAFVRAQESRLKLWMSLERMITHYELILGLLCCLSYMAAITLN